MNNFLIKYAFIFLAALFFQANMVQFIEIASWKPDMVLITLVMFSIRFGAIYGSTAGFFTGLLSDILNGGMLGLCGLSKSVTGFLAANISDYFQEKSQFIFTLLISGLVHDLIYIFINTLGVSINWQVMIFGYIIPNLLYTSIVGIAIYMAFGRWLNDNEQHQF